MDSVKKGVFFVIVSAVILGSTPILARMAYDEGANAATMVFLRAALALPFLLVIMKIRKIPFATSFMEMRDLFLGGIAAASATILLYSSFTYISVGETMTLQFIYPALVSLGCVIFYKEKLTKAILVALILSFAGVSLFYEYQSLGNIESGGTIGFLLAIAGGVSYAIYIIRVDKSSLRQIPTPKITLAVCICAMLCSGIYGLSEFGGGLSFGLSTKGWIYAWIVSLSVTLVAFIFLQLGIKYTGAPAAAILSTFEPITSVLCGAFFLGEHLSFPKVVGCVLIIASVIIVATAGSGDRVKIKTAPDSAICP